VRSVLRTLDRTLVRDILPVCLAVGLVGVSYGATAVAGGLAVWFPVLLGASVLAASAEFIFVGIVMAGGNPIAAVVAALLINVRHLSYGLAVTDVVGDGWRRLVGSHLMNDETVVFALGEDGIDRQRAAYWASGLGILLCWPGGALLGALGGAFVGDTADLGLDAVFPAALLALVLPSLREARVRRAALLGAAVAVATAPFLPAGVPVLGSLAGLAATARRKRSR
jgi:4-azaleucine resistance transporter AzlC